MLLLPVLTLALRLFGQPQHVTRRPSSVSFWAVDLSVGAGSISSPVLEEHPKNVSECAMLWERTFSALATEAPPWLLISALGIATRELASRQVQNDLVPALVTTGEAQPKAQALSKRLRRNFDDRVQVRNRTAARPRMREPVLRATVARMVVVAHACHTMRVVAARETTPRV